MFYMINVVSSHDMEKIPVYPIYNKNYLKTENSILAAVAVMAIIFAIIYPISIFKKKHVFDKRDLVALALSLLCCGTAIWLIIYNIDNTNPKMRLIIVSLIGILTIFNSVYDLMIWPSSKLDILRIASILTIMAAIIIIILQILKFNGNPHSPFENTIIKI